MLAAKKFKTKLDHVLDIEARRARDEETAYKKYINKHKSRHHAVVLFKAIQ
jgi:hypothetical protein